MGYNSVISRSDAAALVPEDVSDVILTNVAGTNPLLQLARRLPNMPRAQTRLPVWSSLPVAYFVSGETGLKQTSEAVWANKYIDAEELAVIIPIPEAVLDDTDYDIWGQLRPEIEKAFGVAIAQAVLYGTNIPASWTTNLGAAGIVAGATAATSPTHTVSLAAYADLYEAVLGETDADVDGVFMLVEADGFPVTGVLAHASMKGKIRNSRSSEGVPLFKTSPQDSTRYEMDGAPLYFPSDGSMVAASSLLIAGDWSQLIYAFRQDVTYKVLDQAVITDTNGTVIFNLAQQDMVALRAVARLGFALPNPVNRMQATAASRFPFSVLTA